MQRRAAALYAVLLLVVGVSAFSLITVATPPELAFDSPEHELGETEEFQVGDTTYTVDAIDAEMQGGGGGGHGGGGGPELVRSGTLVYTNESALDTATWGNGSDVTFRNETYTVLVDGPNATSVTLEGTINRTAILQNDTTVQNDVQTVDGTEYVVREGADGNRTLLPAADYFPEPERLTVEQGQAVQFDGNEYTVAAVGGDGARLSRPITEEIEVSVSNHANVTVGDQTYFAHFPDNETLVLTTNYEQYQAHQDRMDQFTEHENGLWGVSIVTGIGAVFLIALAYLPSRY
ncbi:hypothetical protein [Halobaculum sp. MBLA0143]|uniref:hypothetical protein n=1 Tax=Halobaculum sp. MBLA0143 TaxID=3079933 RepID=UPI003523A4CD